MAARAKATSGYIRVSAAGVNVDAATGDDVLFDTDHASIGVWLEGTATLTASDISSSWNNGYGLTRIYTKTTPLGRTFRAPPLVLVAIKDKTQPRSGAFGATPNLRQDFSLYFYDPAASQWKMTGYRSRAEIIASTTTLTITLTAENFGGSSFSIANYEFAYKVFFS
mgnify:CR=1 FL=1